MLTSLDNNTWIRKSSEKRGRPGIIHHVSDVRWTRGGSRFSSSCIKTKLCRASGVSTSHVHGAFKPSRLDDERPVFKLICGYPPPPPPPPPCVHLTSCTRQIMPGLPRFSPLSLQWYYRQRKPNNRKQGRPGKLEVLLIDTTHSRTMFNLLLSQ